MTSGKEGDLRIILLGKTGAGKSATGNTILGRNAFKENSKICEKQEGDVDGKSIVVFDTPGLFSASITKKQVRAEIEKCVEMSAPGPHVFLLVIKLGVRFTEEERNSVQWIQQNFGKEALLRTIILFTHTDLLRGKSLEEYIRESCYLPNIVDSCGGRYHSFNNKDRYNQHQITELLQKINALRRENRMRHYTPEMFRTIQTEITGKGGMKQLNIIHMFSIVIVIGVILLGTKQWNNRNEKEKVKQEIKEIKIHVQKLILKIEENENKITLLNNHLLQNVNEEKTLKEKLQKKEQEEKKLRNDFLQKEEDEMVLENKIQEKEQEKNHLRNKLLQKEEDEKDQEYKIKEKDHEENQLRNELPQEEQEEVWLKYELHTEEEHQLIKGLLQKQQEKHQLKEDLLEKQQEKHQLKEDLLEKQQEKHQLKEEILQKQHEKHQLKEDLLKKEQEKHQLKLDLLQKEQEKWQIKNKLLENKLYQHQLKKELEQAEQEKQELEKDRQQKENEKHELEKKLPQHKKKMQ